MQACIKGPSVALFLAGCAVVPPLQYDSVAISEVVQRIKCELALAVPEIQGQYPTGTYQWMRYWTAKVDLTLVTNDQAMISPSAIFTTPMNQAVIPNVGTFPRSFTLGTGGGISGIALRNETLSFTVSMDELRDSRYRGDCNLPQQLGLMGNLGLQEWVSSALAPVGNKQLMIGYHAPPTGKSVQLAGPGRFQAAGEITAKDLLTRAEQALHTAEGATENARKFSEAARQSALKKQIQTTYNAVDQAYGYAEAATNKLEEALDLAWQASRMDRDKTPKLSEDDRKALQRISMDAGTTNTRLAKSRDTAAAAWALVPRDPPIDSISHQVQFIVAANVNVTPNWTLVHFKGPGSSGTFASASRTHTNTLNIVLGSPADPGGKTLSDEQKRQLLNQKLDSLNRLLVVPVQ
jgi:hypothetical protein